MSDQDKVKSSFSVSFRWVLLLFLAARLMSLLWWNPPYREFGYHYALAAYSEQGLYPFLDFWMEYPPIYPWISVFFYQLAHWDLLLPLSHQSKYYLLVGVFHSCCEAGLLVVLYRLLRLFYQQALAIQVTLLYGILFFPLFVTLSFFDIVPVLLIFLTLYCLLQHRELLACFFCALGIWTKIIPVILLPVIWKQSRFPWRNVLVIVILSAMILSPFLLVQPKWLGTFWQATWQRPPWETIWALVDQQYDFGYVGPVQQQQGELTASLEQRLHSRFSEDLSQFPQTSERLQTVYPLFGLLFLAIFLWVWLKLPATLSPYGTLVFAAFTMVLFFLYSKGWSPQFILYVLPWLLILLPQRLDLVFLLSLINFCEMPLWLFYFYQNKILLAGVIIARTVILAYLGYLLWNKCKEEIHGQTPREEGGAN